MQEGVQERVQEGFSCAGRGVPVGLLGQFLARKGGGRVHEGRSCGVPVALPGHIMPSRFLAGFHFPVMQKPVANFFASVVRVTP